jgi:hypothetical protein
MKNFYVLVLVIVCIVISHASKAQTATAKPAQFATYPEQLACTEAQLQALFSANAEASIVLSLPGNFIFKGVVQSNEQLYGGQQTVIIRSTNFPGSVFSLSKTADASNNIRYVGRILSFQHSDLYELQAGNSGYTLQKKPFNNVIQTCHQ